MSQQRKAEAHAETRRRGEKENGHPCPPKGGLEKSPAGETFVQSEYDLRMMKRKIWADIERRIIPIKDTGNSLQHNAGA